MISIIRPQITYNNHYQCLVIDNNHNQQVPIMFDTCLMIATRYWPGRIACIAGFMAGNLTPKHYPCGLYRLTDNINWNINWDPRRPRILTSCICCSRMSTCGALGNYTLSDVLDFEPCTPIPGDKKHSCRMDGHTSCQDQIWIYIVQHCNGKAV